MAPSAEKRHLTEHETINKTPPWMRAAMRQHYKLGSPSDFKFGGTVLGDEFFLTDEEYAGKVKALRDHGACEATLQPLAQHCASRPVVKTEPDKSTEVEE